MFSSLDLIEFVSQVLTLLAGLLLEIVHVLLGVWDLVNFVIN